MGAVGGRIRDGSWRGGQREGLSPPPAGPVPRLAAVLFRRCGPPTLCTCGTGKRSSGARLQLRARVRGGLLLVGDEERMYSLTLCGEPCAPAPTAVSLLCTTGMRTGMPDHGAGYR